VAGRVEAHWLQEARPLVATTCPSGSGQLEQRDEINDRKVEEPKVVRSTTFDSDDTDELGAVSWSFFSAPGS
jgi:hypothetical protein